MNLLEKLLSEHGQLKLIVQEDLLYVNDQSFPLGFGSLFSLARRMSDKKIGFLEFTPGITREEVLAFCTQLADPRGGKVQSQTRLKLGEIQIAPKELHSQLEAMRVMDASGDRTDAVSKEVSDLEILYKRVREHMEVKLKNFDEVVLSFLSRFARQANPFIHLGEIRHHNKYTYLHSSNVANLAIGFGLGLGLKGKDLYHLGIAALLHDVGKQFVPVTILNKPSRLNEEEWNIIRRHPIEGSRFLMKQKNVNHLAVVVSFEHHLHYNGLGGYPVCKPPRRPSIPSQLIAIADSFDALFCFRSYHEKYDIMTALEIIHNDRGSIYDPWLVDVFTRYITMNLEEEGLPNLPA